MSPLKLLPVAQAVASLSKDPSTKVGALIVGPAGEIRSSGWNGFPRGVRDEPQRYANRDLKHRLVVHAEQNAICNAARAGTPTEGCSLLVTALHPCRDCAKAVIQAGITTVYAPAPNDNGLWAASFADAELLFNEAGVKVEFYDPDQAI